MGNRERAINIPELQPIPLFGDAAWAATAGSEEASDNDDWQLLVRVATDEGPTGWVDAETSAPTAVVIFASQGMSIPGFQTPPKASSDSIGSQPDDSRGSSSNTNRP